MDFGAVRLRGFTIMLDGSMLGLRKKEMMVVNREEGERDRRLGQGSPLVFCSCPGRIEEKGRAFALLSPCVFSFHLL